MWSQEEALKHLTPQLCTGVLHSHPSSCALLAGSCGCVCSVVAVCRQLARHSSLVVPVLCPLSVDDWIKDVRSMLLGAKSVQDPQLPSTVALASCMPPADLTCTFLHTSLATPARCRRCCPPQPFTVSNQDCDDVSLRFLHDCGYNLHAARLMLTSWLGAGKGACFPPKSPKAHPFLLVSPAVAALHACTMPVSMHVRVPCFHARPKWSCAPPRLHGCNARHVVVAQARGSPSRVCCDCARRDVVFGEPVPFSVSRTQNWT